MAINGLMEDLLTYVIHHMARKPLWQLPLEPHPFLSLTLRETVANKPCSDLFPLSDSIIVLPSNQFDYVLERNWMR